MYMATRRQSNATRMFGLIGTAAVIAVVGVVLVNMRESVVRPLAPPHLQFVTPEPAPTVEPSPIKLKPVEDPSIPLQLPTFTPPEFRYDPPEMPVSAPPVDYGALPSDGTGIAPTSTPVPPAIPRTAPKLIPGDKPEYPPASIRARESGTTSISLCVNKQGRVTSAAVSTSSGFEALDRTALAWIKREHFKPGTENGAPVDVCNHTLSYEWKLPAR